MISRFGLAAGVVLLAAVVSAASAARQPPTGTAMYVVRIDPRLCPSPRCGGYWLEIANGVRTRCADGRRRPRCYVATAVDRSGRMLGTLGDGALVRGATTTRPGGFDELVAMAEYAPAGRAAADGGYYRVVDTGIRCVRAPCYSWRAGQVNGRTGVRVSGVDVAPASASAAENARAKTALRRKDGLYARGRFALSDDGGRVFRATRLYLRAPLPRA